MAGKPLIVQVCFPGGGYKKVAFQRNMNVNDARDMLAEKAQKMDSKEDYGLFIAPTNSESGFWLKGEDSIGSYNLEKKAGLLFKMIPRQTPVFYDGHPRVLLLDFDIPVAEVIRTIVDRIGKNLDSEYLLSICSANDETRGIALSPEKTLGEQCPPNPKLILKKKKKKLGLRNKGRRKGGMIFGEPLENVAVLGMHEGLPVVVARALDYLERNALQLEGIFRISGNQQEIQDAKEKFDQGLDVKMSSMSSPHAVAGLMKLYFRELPEPLLSFQYYEIFVAIYNFVPEEERVKYYKVLLDNLPYPNRVLLERLLPFLKKVVDNAEHNLMKPTNMATVFGPNILRPEDDLVDDVMMQDIGAVNSIISTLICHCDELLSKEPAPYEYVAIVQALFDYEGESESEVSFPQDSILLVITEDESGWWEGEVNGFYGFFPSSYVRVIMKVNKGPVLEGDPTAQQFLTTSEDASAEDASNSTEAYEETAKRVAVPVLPVPAMVQEMKDVHDAAAQPRKRRLTRTQVARDLDSIVNGLDEELAARKALEKMVAELRFEVSDLKSTVQQLRVQEEKGSQEEKLYVSAAEYAKLKEDYNGLRSELHHSTTQYSQLTREVEELRGYVFSLEEKLNSRRSVRVQASLSSTRKNLPPPPKPKTQPPPATRPAALTRASARKPMAGLPPPVESAAPVPVAPPAVVAEPAPVPPPTVKRPPRPHRPKSSERERSSETDKSSE